MMTRIGSLCVYLMYLRPLAALVLFHKQHQGARKTGGRQLMSAHRSRTETAQWGVAHTVRNLKIDKYYLLQISRNYLNILDFLIKTNVLLTNIKIAQKELNILIKLKVSNL